MSKKYPDKPSRSRRELYRLKDDGVKGELGESRVTMQMVLPMKQLFNEVAHAVKTWSASQDIY